MPSFIAPSSIELPRLLQDVYIDDRRLSDAHCTGVAMSEGLNGSTAQLILPARDWDSGKRDLRGAHVFVQAGYKGAGRRAAFSGYIRTAPSDTGSRVIQATAASLLAFADKIPVGEASRGFVVSYPERAWNDEGVFAETGWTIRGILRDLFGLNPEGRTWKGGGGALHPSWTNRLVLGDLSVLSEWWSVFPIGNMEFKRVYLRGALEQILAKVGNVTFRESFLANGQTRLELVELANHEAPVRDCVVARPGASTLGTNVLSIAHEESSEDVCTRVYGFGARQASIVSIATDHATHPLEKGWDEALEEDVLKNPECTKQGDESGVEGDQTRQESDPERAKVFRRYKLPASLMALVRRKEVVIMKDNPIQIEETGGQRKNVPIQVWKVPMKLEWSEGASAWLGTLATEERDMLEGCQHDLEEGVITLNKPAVNLFSFSVEEGEMVDVWVPAIVGVTLTLGAERIFHDTGARGAGMGFSHIADAGLVDIFENDSFQYVQLTNMGAAIEYDLWMFLENEEGVGQWFHWDAATIWRDDRAHLRTFTEGALREKCRTRATYTIQTPFWTDGYRIGERVRVVGQDDFDFGTHQIRSVAYDFTHDHSTTISTDNSVPLVNSTVLDKETLPSRALTIDKASDAAAAAPSVMPIASDKPEPAKGQAARMAETWGLPGTVRPGSGGTSPEWMFE